MKYYYLLNGKIMAANEKTPESNLDKFSKLIHPKVSVEYADWYSSLQPCEISDSELCLILSNVTKLDYDNPIEVTDIVNASVICKVERCVGECIECNHMAIRIVFKHPKEVEEIEAVDGIWDELFELFRTKRYGDKMLEELKSKFTITRNI